jgi:hydroxyacylglutathione hydrolase
MIKIEPIPAFDDNYIWCLYDDQSRKAVVVDPGDANPVIDFLSEKSIDLAGIFITHHHFDHTGGIDALLENNDIPVYGPVNNAIPQISQPLTDQDTLNVLGIDFEVISVPGHTLDHISLYSSGSSLGPLVFCGDTLFAGGCGRIFEGNPAMMFNSLSKLAKLPSETKVYCTHEYTMANLKFAAAVEPNNHVLQQRLIDDGSLRDSLLPTLPSTIEKELLTNPFLRCEDESVISAATLHSSQETKDPVEVFTVIRAWKDNF